MSELETQDEIYGEEEETTEAGYCPQCGAWNDDLTLGCWSCGFLGNYSDESEALGVE